MTEPTYDLIIRGGRVATTTDVFEADVAISGETIAAIGRGLPPARREIDARGKLVLPGGVDSHAHIEQLSAARFCLPVFFAIAQLLDLEFGRDLLFSETCLERCRKFFSALAGDWLFEGRVYFAWVILSGSCLGVENRTDRGRIDKRSALVEK